MDNEEQSTIEKSAAPAMLPIQEKLKGSWQLLKEACGEYRARLATYLAFFSIPIILAILLSGLSYATMSPPFAYMPLLSGVKIVLSILSLFAGILAGFALLLSVREGYGAKEALIQAMRNLLPYMLVSFLVCSSLIGGSFLFLVPGFLFLVWFSFSFFVFVFEGKMGMDALLRSKQLVSGSFWKVAGRMFFLVILLLMLTVPLAILGRYVGHWGNLVLGVFTLLFTPVMLLYSLFLFRDLVRIQGNATPVVSKTSFRALVWFSVLLGTPFIVGMIAFRSMLLVTHDIPEPDDSDLRLSAVNVPREENAYYVFSEVKEADIFWPSEKGLDAMLSGKTWDESVVQEVLQKNEKALQVFERGVILSAYQQPELQNPDVLDANTVIDGVIQFRKMAQLNTILALSLSRQGKEKEAVEQVLKVIKMSKMLLDGQNGTIIYLSSVVSRRISFEALQVIVGNSSKLSSYDLVRYARDIALYESGSKPLQNVFRGEYTITVNSLKNEDLLPISAALVQKKFPLLHYYFLPNKTKLLFMSAFGRSVENSKQSSYNQVRLFGLRYPSYPKIFFTENAIGKVMIFTIMNGFEHIFVKEFEDDFLVRSTQTILALKAFERDRGVLPNTLQELIPAYLSEVPQDPFDGKEIRYVPERRIFYSVGKDLIDDGGDIDEENWQGGKDIGFPVR